MSDALEKLARAKGNLDAVVDAVLRLFCIFLMVLIVGVFVIVFALLCKAYEHEQTFGITYDGVLTPAGHTMKTVELEHQLFRFLPGRDWRPPYKQGRFYPKCEKCDE